MHVVIATAGALPPAPVADFLESIWKQGFTLSVMTAVQVPEDLVEEFSDEPWNPLFDDGDHRSPAREKASAYVAERGSKLAEPILAALAGRGMQASPVFVEAADPADAIVETAEQLCAHLIVMGATKRIFKESSWTSISAQVVDRTRIPTLVIPGARMEQDPESTGD